MAEMNRLLQIFVSLALLAAAGCSSVPSVPSEPRNLDLLKAEIRDYINKGPYQAAIAAQAAKADAWLIERAAKRVTGERLAVVFDLDETLISNWSQIDSLGMGYTAAGWEAWVEAGKAPAMVPSA